MRRPISNPPNPWTSGVERIEYLGEAPPAELSVTEEQARSILSENDSPDLPFRWSLNPYRGCTHGCSYCYARRTHQYLGWGAGTDFERRIVAKTNAAQLLRRRFERPDWTGERIAFSGVTDCYQPLEARYGLTRDCLRVCLAYRNPVVIITKGALVRRDLELLAQLARETPVLVYMSIPFADEQLARALEPDASPLALRFEALEALSAAGVTTGVSLAPLVPGLNDSHVPRILERAAACGASHAFQILLRLPGEVRPVFVERLEQALPAAQVRKVLGALAEMRGEPRDGDDELAGERRVSDGTSRGARRAGAGRRAAVQHSPRASDFGQRMVGVGPRWQAAADLFELHCRRLGLGSREAEAPAVQTFRRPGTLFPGV